MCFLPGFIDDGLGGVSTNGGCFARRCKPGWINKNHIKNLRRERIRAIRRKTKKIIRGFAATPDLLNV
jgi:hypothetical protein